MVYVFDSEWYPSALRTGSSHAAFLTGKRLPRSTTTVKENVEKLKLLVQKEVIRY